MSETDEVLYVCAGICRVDPGTDKCIGCGRPANPAAQKDFPATEEYRDDNTQPVSADQAGNAR